MHSFAVFLSIAVAIAAVNATDYCSKSICGNSKHIACDNNGKFYDSCPSDAKMLNINNDMKKLLVDEHNAKRNFIAGGGDSKHKPACRMATMEWDNELAELAALNVKQCKMSHDACHNTDAFKSSGQNLAWMGYYGTTPSMTDILKKSVEMWYNEVKDSKQEYIDSYPSGYNGPTIGHFTVMMADRNIRLGCAASTYSQKPYQAYLVACNYATTNMINFPIYTSCNKAGSSCKSGTNPNYSNLCSTSEKYDVNKWF